MLGYPIPTVPMVYPWYMDAVWIVYEECLEVGNAHYRLAQTT